MKIGFIGCGNMGGAIMGGILKANIAKNGDIYAYDAYEAALKSITEKNNINPCADNAELVKKSDIIFLCIKPNAIFGAIDEIKGYITREKLVISIVAGIPIQKIEKAFATDISLIRVMPNTPALVGEGMSAICANENAKGRLSDAKAIFESFGKAVIVSENQMDIVTSISGSSPAYVFMMIEAMADAGVRGGLKRSDAYVFAAQAVLGSAKMVLDTGKHPGELKDMVCSPSGTTIDAVAVLEQEGFRSSIIKAMKACEDKSKSLS